MHGPELDLEWGWDTKYKITYSHMVYSNLIMSTSIRGNKEHYCICSSCYYLGQIFIYCLGRFNSLFELGLKQRLILFF